MMTLSIVLFTVVLFGINGEPEVNRLVQVDHEGREIAMDVIHDPEDKTVMAVVGDVSKYEDGVQTVNFHDYNSGYGVLKNVNRRICIMTKTPISMATAEKYRVGFTAEVQEHILENFEVIPTYEDVNNIAGPKVATFCKDYTTVAADPTPIRIKQRATNKRRLRRATWCVFTKCAYNQDELDSAIEKD